MQRQATGRVSPRWPGPRPPERTLALRHPLSLTPRGRRRQRLMKSSQTLLLQNRPEKGTLSPGLSPPGGRGVTPEPTGRHGVSAWPLWDPVLSRWRHRGTPEPTEQTHRVPVLSRHDTMPVPGDSEVWGLVAANDTGTGCLNGDAAGVQGASGLRVNPQDLRKRGSDVMGCMKVSGQMVMETRPQRPALHVPVGPRVCWEGGATWPRAGPTC